VLLAAAVALAGCAQLLDIQDRTLDTIDATSGDGASEGSSPGLDAFSAGEAGSGAASDGGANRDGQGAPDAQGDRTVQGSIDAGADVQGGDGGRSPMDAAVPEAGDAQQTRDAQPDAQEGHDALASGDSPNTADAQGGGGAQQAGDAGADAPTCPDPCTVLTGLNHPYFIASDANRVYWTEFGDDFGTANGAVKSCPIAGCGAGPTVYTSSQINPAALAVDAQNVYWGSASYGGVVGAIWSCPISGCTTPARLSSAGIPYGIAVDATYVYWVDNDDGTVHKIAKVGGTDGVLYDAGSSFFFDPGLISVDTAFVYVSDDNNQVARVPVTGGEPILMAVGPRAGYFPVVTDSTSLYFGEEGQILVASKTSQDGGVPLTSSVPWPIGLALDPPASTVYWADYGSGLVDDGTVGKVGIDGGGATVLASSLVTPQGVAVSGSFVFWLSFGTLNHDPMASMATLARTGALFRAAK